MTSYMSFQATGSLPNFLAQPRPYVATREATKMVNSMALVALLSGSPHYPEHMKTIVKPNPNIPAPPPLPSAINGP